jgi:hypothetical protein
LRQVSCRHRVRLGDLQERRDDDPGADLRRRRGVSAGSEDEVRRRLHRRHVYRPLIRPRGRTPASVSVGRPGHQVTLWATTALAASLETAARATTGYLSVPTSSACWAIF